MHPLPPSPPIKQSLYGESGRSILPPSVQRAWWGPASCPGQPACFILINKAVPTPPINLVLFKVHNVSLLNIVCIAQRKNIIGNFFFLYEWPRTLNVSSRSLRSQIKPVWLCLSSLQTTPFLLTSLLSKAHTVRRARWHYRYENFHHSFNTSEIFRRC
jgi:hypothetical protein